MARILTIVVLIAVAIAVFTLTISPPDTRYAYNTENLFALHVIANSDTPEDRELKLKAVGILLKKNHHLAEKTTFNAKFAP